MSEETGNGNGRGQRKGSSETRQVLVLVGVVALIAGGIGGAGIIGSLSDRNREQGQAPQPTASLAACQATLEPMGGLSAVTPEAAQALAADLAGF